MLRAFLDLAGQCIGTWRDLGRNLGGVGRIAVDDYQFLDFNLCFERFLLLTLVGEVTSDGPDGLELMRLQ